MEKLVKEFKQPYVNTMFLPLNTKVDPAKWKALKVLSATSSTSLIELLDQALLEFLVKEKK